VQIYEFIGNNYFTMFAAMIKGIFFWLSMFVSGILSGENFPRVGLYPMNIPCEK